MACTQTNIIPIASQNVSTRSIDSTMLSNLQLALSISPSNYVSNYEMREYIREWEPFGSGSTNIDDESIISIEVTNDQISAFEERYSYFNGFPDESREQNIIYEKNNGLCTYDLMTSSVCLPSVVRDPQSPDCTDKTFGYDCGCSFNSTEAPPSCVQEMPPNIDTSVKNETSSFLNSIQLETLETHNDTRFGTCYEGMYSNMTQTFCFDNSGLISYAQWGTNITIPASYSPTAGANINIHTVEKTS